MSIQPLDSTNLYNLHLGHTAHQYHDNSKHCVSHTLTDTYHHLHLEQKLSHILKDYSHLNFFPSHYCKHSQQSNLLLDHLLRNHLLVIHLLDPPAGDLPVADLPAAELKPQQAGIVKLSSLSSELTTAHDINIYYNLSLVSFSS